MVKRVDRPYWINWLRWHFYHRYLRRKAAQRRAAWTFINLIRRMPPGSLVIDGGANVGKVTSAFVRQGFEVHAFEPDPVAAALFERRFHANPLVHLHRSAVGARADTLKLYRTKKFAARPQEATTSSSLFQRDAHDGAHVIDVEVVDLIAFVRSLGRRVDLLKLDVEGAEVDILERLLDEGVNRDIGVIFVETHERHSPDLAQRTAAIRSRIAAAGIDNINLDWI